MKINYKELEDKIYNYPTKYPAGFLQREIEVLLKDYPDISREHFDNAMIGNTCQAVSEDGEKLLIVNYHCDVLKGIICGLEARELTAEEWD